MSPSGASGVEAAGEPHRPVAEKGNTPPEAPPEPSPTPAPAASAPTGAGAIAAIGAGAPALPSTQGGLAAGTAEVRSTLEGINSASRNPFPAMDSVKAAADGPSLLSGSGGAQPVGGDGSGSGAAVHLAQLDVGYRDPSLGYVELRAHLDASGVHASLTAQSAASGALLEGHLESLAGWMHARQTPVESLTVASFAGGRGSYWQGGASDAPAHSGHDGTSGQAFGSASGAETGRSVTEPGPSGNPAEHNGGDAEGRFTIAARSPGSRFSAIA